jgi:hypothetical protein
MGAHLMKKPKRRRGAFGPTMAAIAGIGLAVAGASPAFATGGSNNGSEKISYCHAKPADTAKNGWNYLTTSVNAFFKSGHPQHAADIVPPFTYEKQGQTINFPGMNWDAEGQAVFNNGCKAPETPEPPKPVVVNVSVSLDGKCGVNNDDVSPSTSDKYTSGEPVWNNSVVSVPFTMKDGVNAVFTNGNKTITVQKDEVNTEPCVDEPTPVKVNAPSQKVIKCALDTVTLPKQDEGVKLESDTGWVDNGDGTATRVITYAPTAGNVLDGQSVFTFEDSSVKCEPQPETLTQCLSFGSFPAGSVWYAQVSRTGSEDILDGPFPLTKTTYSVSSKNLYGVVFFVMDKPGGTVLATSGQLTKDNIGEKCITLNPKDKPKPTPTPTPTNTGGGGTKPTPKPTSKPSVTPTTSSTSKPAPKPTATTEAPAPTKRGIGANTGIESVAPVAASAVPAPAQGVNWLVTGLGLIITAAGLTMLRRRTVTVRS